MLTAKEILQPKKIHTFNEMAELSLGYIAQLSDINSWDRIVWGQ